MGILLSSIIMRCFEVVSIPGQPNDLFVLTTWH